MPVVRLLLVRVHAEAKSIARFRDDTTNDGLVFIGESPPVCCDASGRLAKDRDLRRVPTEPGDILVHPFDGSALVAQPEVLSVTGSSWESQHAETVREGDDHRSCSFGEAAAIVKGRVGVADGEACVSMSAMDAGLAQKPMTVMTHVRHERRPIPAALPGCLAVKEPRR